jgi:hypothetical protein
MRVIGHGVEQGGEIAPGSVSAMAKAAPEAALPPMTQRIAGSCRC